jgi:hypothetical protein
MTTQPQPDGDGLEEARRQTSTPGVVLFLSGLLNGLLALLLIVSGIQAMRMSTEEYAENIRQLGENNPALADMIERMLADPGALEGLKLWSGPITLGWGIVSLLLAVVVCFGGLAMRRLRGFGLSVAGAVIAVVPLLSCTSCCGFGEVAGIWALVVLFHPEVRSAFRQGQLQRGEGNEPTH